MDKQLFKISIGSRLILAFSLVILLTTISIAILITTTADSEVSIFVNEGTEKASKKWADKLGEYYEEQQSWKGVEDYIWFLTTDSYIDTLLNRPVQQTTSDQNNSSSEEPIISDLNLLDRSLILVNNMKLVEASLNNDEFEIGTSISEQTLNEGTKINFNGQIIGWVLVGYNTEDIFLTKFIETFNVRLIYISLLIGIAGIIVAFILSNQMTRPLRDLIKATKNISAGNLNENVRISDIDEIGILGNSFNQMAQRLQNAEKRRQQIVADMSHELRNPLSVVKANLEGMIDGILPSKTENIEKVHQQTIILSKLIEDLRLISMAEAGELRLYKQKTNINTLTQKILDDFKIAMQKKNIKLETKISTTPISISIDPIRIEQVLNNIISNALRYVAKNDSILIQINEKLKNVEIIIKDSGPGIEQNKQQYIFDRFYRIDKSRSRQHGGSGLGLSIAKELVQAHLGTISLKSNVGKGTTFTISIPKT